MVPQDAVKVMAKSLVRNRHAVTKLYGLKSQLQGVSLRIAVRTTAMRLRVLVLSYWDACMHSGQQLPAGLAPRQVLQPLSSSLDAMQTLKSTQAMADAMKGATKVSAISRQH